ncbi:hypothetical protein IFM89_029450, partial [Coptis chinensis]
MGFCLGVRIKSFSLLSIFWNVWVIGLMKISNRLMLIFEASEHVIDLINQGNYDVIHQQKSIPIFQTATGKLVEELKSSMMKALSVLNGNDDNVAHTGVLTSKRFSRDTQPASLRGVNFVIMNEDVLLEEAGKTHLVLGIESRGMYRGVAPSPVTLIPQLSKIESKTRVSSTVSQNYFTSQDEAVE